jgi:D-alanine-D-alanine ligase-like ATP-grasp enzyme
VSVDFVLDVNRHLWILELNASPQKSMYREIRGFRNIARLYRAPLQYAVYLYEQQ